MNIKDCDFFTIIKEGENKGKRLYFEDKCGLEHTLPVEMYCLFQNAFKNNYKVFFLNCLPIHDIEIPQNDVNFLKKSIKVNEENIYKEHFFSENTLKIKDLQYKDILKIYTLSLKDDNVGAVFFSPVWIENKYCFNIFLISQNSFHLDNLLNLKLDLININSVIEHTPDTLSIDLMKSVYDVLNYQFKDYIIPYEETKKTEPYNLFDLPEKKELIKVYNEYFKYQYENKYEDDLNSIAYENQISILKEKLSIKESELQDIELYKKFLFQKLCNQLYIFHKIIMSDSHFFTNFLELSDSISVESNNGELKYNSYHYWYCLSDMYAYDDYQLFSIFCRVYYWRKK